MCQTPGDSESCGIQWMKRVRVYDVFSFVQHMVEHIRKNAVVSHVIFGDGILCTHRFHHLRSVYVIRVVYYLIQLQGIIHFGV